MFTRSFRAALAFSLGFSSLYPTFAKDVIVVDSPESYVRAHQFRLKPSDLQIEVLFGRAQNYKPPAQALSMTNDPQRRVMFYLGPDGLAEILNASGYDVLHHVGYEPDYIRFLASSGAQFQLTVFTDPGDLLIANWDNVVKTVAKYYPRIADKVLAQLPNLKTKELPEILAEARAAGSPNFAEVDRNKMAKSHPFYINEEALLKRKGELWEVRAFLYYVVRLTELYKGDGRILKKDGTRGAFEYVGGNYVVANLKSKAIIPLQVDLPCKVTLP